jgi:hypothetical protein
MWGSEEGSNQNFSPTSKNFAMSKNTTLNHTSIFCQLFYHKRHTCPEEQISTVIAFQVQYNNS